MNSNEKICPVESAGMLDGWWRRILQHPKRLLSTHVKPGMTVLDIGCGPGFFTLEMAKMVGQEGHVIAADIQQGMLDKVAAKLNGPDLRKRITLHLCPPGGIGVKTQVDFALAFYMVHEVPDKEAFFRELAEIIKPGGILLVIEPPFHVSANDFAKTVDLINRFRFGGVKKVKMFLSHGALFRRV